MSVRVLIGLQVDTDGVARAYQESKEYAQTTGDWAAQQFQADTTAAGIDVTPSVAGTAGLLMFQLLSLSGATKVELGVQDGGGTFVPFAELTEDSAGVADRALFPLAAASGATIYAKTDAGTAQVYVTGTPR